MELVSAISAIASGISPGQARSSHFRDQAPPAAGTSMPSLDSVARPPFRPSLGANQGFLGTMAPGHFITQSGPVLGRPAPAGPRAAHFHGAGRGGSLPAHFVRTWSFVAFAWAVQVLGAFSKICARASCTGCIGSICGTGSTCVRASSLAAQAWNCLNRTSAGGSLFSV